jgi:transposase
MGNDWVKIALIAEELGVSVKTIYNWISVNKLFMPRPGYVSRVDAYEVWLQQKDIRKIHSYFVSIQGITRDPNGRFKSKRNPTDGSTP